jgi:serine/threonine protein kinase/WD40 repeat protein
MAVRRDQINQNPKMSADRWKQIDQLMDAAFELPPDQISQFLKDACAGDESLKHDVERYLAADDRARNFIESRVLDGLTQSSDPEALLSTLTQKRIFESPFHTRNVLGERYELIKKLGKGGMGEVWHAFDMRLRVDVALKSLRLDLRKNPTTVEHLRREVRVAREVLSPNVCRIFDLVVVDQDTELISMEYIDGTTLVDLLSQSGPLELPRARDIAAQFLAGLEAIHQAGLVHRDLKPENIMITHTGRVVVMDFGISQRVAQMTGTVAGTLPYMSPEQISGSQVDGRSDIFAAGVVLAEMIHTKGTLSGKTRESIWHAVRVDASRIPDSPWKLMILRAVAPNREDRYQSVGALMRALEEVTQRIEGIDEQRPYPGLAAFSASDTEYFFGRELEVETLLKKIQQSYMLALVGPSGAGKTSFLRAGLIPALPADWCSVFTFPGDAPILNLAQSISRTIGDPKQFEDPDEAVGRFQNLRNSYKEIVLIIDRFEELFTLNSHQVQSRYIGIIERLSQEANVRMILSMRDDFLIQCKNHESLNPIFSELTPIIPLAGAGLRRAVVQPALKCGYRFEDETMVDRLLSDVENERGALPLLAFATARLWEKRDRQNGLLTRQAYKEIGGVSGSLAQYAEKILAQMSEAQQSIVREIFRNLVTAQNTRAARDVEDLLSVFPNRMNAEEVLSILIDARLLTSFDSPSNNEGTNKRRVEIIHESLLTAWPRLIRWQTQDADSAQMRDQLRQASQVWDQRGKSQDLLWTGTAYLEYQTWRQRYAGRLTSSEEAFVHAMTQHVGKKRKQRQLVVIGAFVTMLAIIAVITFLWRNASQAKDEALAGTRQAEAGRVLAIARSLSLDPSTKLAYALRSLEFADNPEARRFAMQALSEGPTYHQSGVLTIAPQMSPDGKWLAASQHGGGLLLFPQDGSTPITVNEPDSPSSHHIPWHSQFSPDSELLLWTWRKKMSVVNVWSISKRKVVKSFTFEGMTLCFVRNGKAFFVSDESRKLDDPLFWQSSIVRVWDLGPSEPEILGRVNLNGAGWKSFDIDYQGRWIAYTKDNAVLLEDLQSLENVPAKVIGKHNAKTRIVRFNPIGNEIGTADDLGEIRLWSLNFTSNRKEPLRIFKGNGQVLFNFWFDPDGTSLMVPRDGMTLRWDLTAPQDVEPSILREYATHGTFDTKQRLLVMPGITVYDYQPPPFYEFRGLVPTQGSSSVRFTPDGKSWISGFTEDGISIHRMPGERHSPVRRFWNHQQWTAQSLDVDPTGRYVAAVADNVHLVSIQDANDTTLKRISPINRHWFVAFSPDGKNVAAVNSDGIEVWDLATRNSRILSGSKVARIIRIVFSQDGSLFSGDVNGTIRRWNLADGSTTEIAKSRRKGEISGMAISNDGRLLAASTWTDKTSELSIHDLQNGKSSIISSHGNRVESVAFDPKGTKFITGDSDGLIRVGSVTGETPLLLFGHRSEIVDIQVHPNGNWILSGEGGNPIVRLWRMPKGKPIQLLPLKEFQNVLREMTNVRVVPDENLPGGHRTELDKFAGWGKGGKYAASTREK